jgi:hypothetical protein
LTEFCLDWLPNVDFVLRFEDIEAKLRADDNALTTYFEPILAAAFGTLPADATERIRAGGAGNISATYSRTATSGYDTMGPDDVYGSSASWAANDLRRLAVILGY